MKQINVLMLAYWVAGLLGVLLSGGVAYAIPDAQHAASVAPVRTCIDGTGNPVPGNDICRDAPEVMDRGAAAGSSELCIDPFDTRQCFSVRLGRHIGSDRDILGELDGIRVDYSMRGGLKLHGIAGFPVSTSGETFDPARKVFGISAATKRLARPWDVNGFLLEQQNDGNTENRSMGGIVRYTQPEWSWLVYLDYDAAENSWGATTASGAWKIPSGTTLSATLDRRTQPIPDRQLTYLQQSRSVLKGWDLALPVDQVAAYTRDGNGEVSTLAVGVSQALSRRIQLSGDLAVLEAGGGIHAEAVKTVQAREYLYHSRLSGNSLLLPGDHNNLDVRYNLSPAGRVSSVAFDAQYKMAPHWNVTPVLRCDHRSAGPDNPSSWVISPVLKMDYRPNRHSGLQIKAGGAWARGIEAETVDSRGSYFVSLAYQSRF
jgi:hypothetical protein